MAIAFELSCGRDDQSVALLAWPIAWGETGVMSFMIDQQDRVYQANLGEESAAKAQEITRFTPDADSRLAGGRTLKKTPGCTHATGRFHSLSPGEASEKDHAAKAGFVLDNAASSALMLPEFAAHTPSLVFVTC